MKQETKTQRGKMTNRFVTLTVDDRRNDRKKLVGLFLFVAGVMLVDLVASAVGY